MRRRFVNISGVDTEWSSKKGEILTGVFSQAAHALEASNDDNTNCLNKRIRLHAKVRGMLRSLPADEKRWVYSPIYARVGPRKGSAGL